MARKGVDEVHQRQPCNGNVLPHSAPYIGIRHYELEEEVLAIMDKKISARMACALQEYLSNSTRQLTKNLSDSDKISSQCDCVIHGKVADAHTHTHTHAHALLPATNRDENQGSRSSASKAK